MEAKKKEIQQTKADFYKYCEKNLKIVNVHNELVPLVPNQEQRILIDYVIECLKNQQPIRVIILKARKIGFSTIIEALMYWWTATHRNVDSRVISHDEKSARTIYNMFQRFYENSDDFYRPAKKYYTKKDLTFDNDAGTGLKSSMSIATAENTSVGRGDTISWLHASETAFWGDGGKIAAGMIEAVPMVPNTAIFLESTANGMGGYFYEEWQAAKDGKSIYHPFFFPWYEHDEYRLNPPKDFKLKAEEEELKKIYNLDNAQIHWYRTKKKSYSHDPKLIKQEHPFNDTEAFLASGRPRFNIDELARMEKFAREPKYYDIFEKNGEVKTNTVQLSPLKVWRTPREDKQYSIGVDVSEGLDTGDYSVIDVMRRDNMETVARWRGHIEPAELGDIVEMIARWYNKALVGVEVNNHGLTVVQRLRDRRYDNLYRREKGFDERLEQATAKLGWKTDMRSKPLMINDLSEALNERKIKDYDIVFIRECMKYVIDSRGRTNAQQGSFDDTVIAKAINLQLFEWSDVTKTRRATPSKIPKKYKEAKAKNRKLVKNKV